MTATDSNFETKNHPIYLSSRVSLMCFAVFTTVSNQAEHKYRVRHGDGNVIKRLPGKPTARAGKACKFCPTDWERLDTIETMSAMQQAMQAKKPFGFDGFQHFSFAFKRQDMKDQSIKLSSLENSLPMSSRFTGSFKLRHGSLKPLLTTQQVIEDSATLCQPCKL